MRFIGFRSRGDGGWGWTVINFFVDYFEYGMEFDILRLSCLIWIKLMVIIRIRADFYEMVVKVRAVNAICLYVFAYTYSVSHFHRVAPLQKKNVESRKNNNLKYKKN